MPPLTSLSTSAAKTNASCELLLAAYDKCPRSVTAPLDIDPFPNGKIKDKGCETKKSDKTFGDPIFLDVFVKP